MEENKLQDVVSKNLVKFRNMAGLTQKELAKKINYSDKSISQWEKGERLPDFSVFVTLCEIYQIKLDNFLENDEDIEIKNDLKAREKNKKHILFAGLSISIVFFVASFLLFIFSMNDDLTKYMFYPLIFALPISALILLIFSLIWWRNFMVIISLTLLNWGIFFNFMFMIDNLNFWSIIIFFIIIQIIITIMLLLALSFKKIRQNKFGKVNFR